MFIQHKKRLFSFFIFTVSFSASLLLTTCGIDEYYYLPQVPETNIITQFNTLATINLPALDPNRYSYARNYKIFYRIYIGGQPESGTIDTSSIRYNINPSLESDFTAIYPNTDPTSTTAGTPANTLFNSRNYYELALEGTDINSLLTLNGGNVRILFSNVPGSYPVLSFNNGADIRLFRSGYFLSINSSWNTDEKRFFRNTSDINVTGYADLVSRTDLSPSYAYVSMYVVAVGINQNFTPVYSRPTHISIFKLPDNN